MPRHAKHTAHAGPWRALVLGGLLAVMTVSTPADARGSSITSQQIIQESLDLVCLDYQVIGGCLWMTCTIVGCEFDESIRVQHQIPEVVVTAYPFLGKSPWVESNRLVRPTAFAQDGGFSDEGGSMQREQALKFKNVDVIGSPALLGYWSAAHASDTLPFCRPVTYPMTPHFISTLDPAWRDPTIETPLTLANLFNTVGKGSSRFAGLFPRIGFVKQSHDYKSTLTAAIRAMDFVRQARQPHVYLPLNANATRAQGQWPPTASTQRDWQQLTPTVQSCKQLPDIDDTVYLTDPYRGRVNQTYGNSWQIWREYRCCPRKGTTLVMVF